MKKNIGYLIAIKNGVDVISETDDDNYPYKDFFLDKTEHYSAKSIRTTKKPKTQIFQSFKIFTFLLF